MTTYLARSAWTSTTASGATLTGTKLRGVAVHWPGTTQTAIGDPGQAAIAVRLRSYRTFHVESNGWSDIGYNIAIDQGGRVWMCRSTQWRGNRVGAHCASVSNPDANHEYVGMLLLLGQTEPLSAKMIAAFRDWYYTRFLPGWPGRTDVRGHGQVSGAQTNCPGTQAKARIADGTLTAEPMEDDMFDPAVHIDAIAEETKRRILNHQNPWGRKVGEEAEFPTIEVELGRIDKRTYDLVTTTTTVDVDEQALAEALAALLQQFDMTQILTAIQALPAAIRADLKAAL